MTILTQWKILSRLPGGRWLFSRSLGFLVPYAGTIGAQVESLRPGHTRVSMPDRRGVRNHLGSIHACALANLGELALGLAMTALQPKNGRFIPVKLEVDYLKKARGPLSCEVNLPYQDWPDQADWTAEAPLKDDSGETVCRVVAHYKVGRKQ
jgi:acyl-coenzyme A thioesterase PaaI-like protein